MDKLSCSGCGLCVEKCKQHALYMKRDERGFSYPVKNLSQCNNCGMCDEICSFVNTSKSKNTICYAGKSKDVDIQKRCSSGGIAHTIANYCLNNNYAVFACVMDGKRAIHKKINYASEADGSKYVQSDITACYSEIYHEVKKNNKIVFIGVACQIEAIKKYVASISTKDTNQLITIDVLCHGVPSPGVFEDYLQWIEKKRRTKISEIVFRSKENGWKNCTTGNKIILKNGRWVDLNLYYQLYFKHIILRPSCTNCSFHSMNRNSDMTLSDFWNIQDYLPGKFDDNGVSRILINTSKGKWLFDQIENSIEVNQVDIKCCENVKQFHCSSKLNAVESERFYALYNKNPKKAFNKVLWTDYCYKLKAKIKRIIQYK